MRPHFSNRVEAAAFREPERAPARNSTSQILLGRGVSRQQGDRPVPETIYANTTGTKRVFTDIRRDVTADRQQERPPDVGAEVRRLGVAVEERVHAALDGEIARRSRRREVELESCSKEQCRDHGIPDSCRARAVIGTGHPSR